MGLWVFYLVGIGSGFFNMAYPILVLGERIPGYSELLTERKQGEIKRSLVVVFSMFPIVIGVCWGWFGKPYLVLASVLAWGLGDAAAALIGKRFGRHFLEGKGIEGRKSLEGTLAMFVMAFGAVLVVLLVNGSANLSVYFPIALVTGVVCALVELYTKNGMDTITCPLAAAAILIPLIHLLGV